MAPKFFPLRWESTGDQWWFASPIDWAAANGHYDLVRELLHIDANLLIKLTSLSRIRRLETVWDDEVDRHNDVAKCRSSVARKLLDECENKGYNSLIRAGYGGWLLYTAAAAGDLVFVKELLERDSLLVFGEGEYGITDIFYAAARGGSCEVFRVLFDCAVAQKGGRGEVSPVFRWEMMNRAVHAAARGGSAAVLAELLGDGSDVLSFRDSQGSTVLHTAAGRGQIQIVKNLISAQDDVVDAEDDRGNTAVHVAAYRGHLAVMKVLISASPSSALRRNSYGDTLLHMAIAGFHAPSFRRVEKQIEVMREIVGGNLVSIQELINAQNNDGRSALHMAVLDTIQSHVVELLLSVRCVDLNLRDGDGNTPLDLLEQRPRSPSSEILIKRLVSAGGARGRHQDRTVENGGNAHMRMRGIGGSPGTSFRIPDAEMVLYTGLEEGCGGSSSELVNLERVYSGEVVSAPTTAGATPSSELRKSGSMTSRFKILLRWPRRRDGAYFVETRSRNSPISLREQFSRPSNKRIASLQGNAPSPNSRRKFGNPRQVLPKSNLGSPCSVASESTWSSSPASLDKRTPKAAETVNMKRRSGSFSLGLMNNYFCFGAQGLAVENSIRAKGQRPEDRDTLVDVV